MISSLITLILLAVAYLVFGIESLPLIVILYLIFKRRWLLATLSVIVFLITAGTLVQ